MLDANSRGEKVDSLRITNTQEKEEPDFTSSAGEESITRFDTKNKKKSKNKRKKSSRKKNVPKET